MKNAQPGFLLACFDGKHTAGKARRNLTDQLRAQGDKVLETGIVEVGENHKGSAHDPHFVLWGTLTATIVYGLCGFAGAYGAWSVIIWALVGAIGGWIFAYYYIRHVTKSELARICAGLPAQSSALAIWVVTDDARRVLETTATEAASVASIATIEADLTTHVFAGPANPVELPASSAGKIRDDDTTLLTLVMFRYAKPETAKQTAVHPPADSPLEVVAMIRNDANGHRRMSDPYLGVKAFAHSDMLWWGGFGLVVGALSGWAGGGGILGGTEQGVATAILWGLAGFGVGAIYGLIIVRTISQRGLKSVGSVLSPGTSILVAWVDAAHPLTESVLDEYTKPGSERLVLNFNTAAHGAVLEAV
jgi:hypothetical protein